MKTQTLAMLAMALFVSNALAQGTQGVSKSQTKIETEGVSSKGFRVSLVKPMLKVDAKISYEGSSQSANKTLDEALGFGLGYASLPVQELGWTTNLTYMDIKNEGSTIGVLRLDGNLAYAFTQIVNIKGGLNLSKFTSGTNADKMNPAIGFQGGVGVQLTRNFGIDVGYTQMNQTRTVDDISLDLKESGLEIGLNGTF